MSIVSEISSVSLSENIAKKKVKGNSKVPFSTIQAAVSQHFNRERNLRTIANECRLPFPWLKTRVITLINCFNRVLQLHSLHSRTNLNLTTHALHLVILKELQQLKRENEYPKIRSLLFQIDEFRNYLSKCVIDRENPSPLDKMFYKVRKK